MNNIYGMSIKTIFKLIKRNIILIGCVFAVFLLAAFIGSRELFSSCSVKASVRVIIGATDTEKIENYLEKSEMFKETCFGYLKDDVVLKGVADKYNLEVKDLRTDIKYSSTGEIITVIYDGGKTLDNGCEILNSVIGSWTKYIQQEDVSAFKGTIKGISSAQINEDMTKSRNTFIFVMIFIGAVLGLVGGVLKGVYWRTFDDEDLIYYTIKEPIQAFIKKGKNNQYDNNINNELELKNLLLNITRNNSKIINFTTVNGNNKSKIIMEFYKLLKKENNNVVILDLDNDELLKTADDYVGISCNVYKKENNETRKIFDELGQKYDFVLVTCNEANIKGNEFVLNKYADITVLNIQVGKSKKYDTKKIIYKLKEDNKNIAYIASK